MAILHSLLGIFCVFGTGYLASVQVVILFLDAVVGVLLFAIKYNIDM
jgi:hypothetical protein